jgi:hypothetical protein
LRNDEQGVELGDMSTADATAPKQRVVGVPFKPGQSGNPAGRPIGARNKLSTDFLADLHNAWREFGPDALARCAKEEPGKFCQIVSNLLPRDISIDVNVAVEPQAFADRFRQAYALLGNEPPQRLSRPMKVINAR